MRCALITVVALMISFVQASAQPLPDYPFYQMSVHVSLTTPSSINSNQNGILIAEASGLRSFHFMQLMLVGDRRKLRFSYSCIYSDTASQQLVQTPTYDDGSICPPGGTATSHFVRAIRITLEGTEAQNYTFTAQCRMAYFRQPTHTNLPVVGSGQWCGNTLGSGAPLEWITRIELRLHRN